MNETLIERVDTAVQKMREAKKQYNKIIDVYGDRDRSQADYKSCFSAIQSNTYSAIDILLSCFVEEKGMAFRQI